MRPVRKSYRRTPSRRIPDEVSFVFTIRRERKRTMKVAKCDFPIIVKMPEWKGQPLCIGATKKLYGHQNCIRESLSTSMTTLITV